MSFTAPPLPPSQKIDNITRRVQYMSYCDKINNTLIS